MRGGIRLGHFRQHGLFGLLPKPHVVQRDRGVAQFQDDRIVPVLAHRDIGEVQVRRDRGKVRQGSVKFYPETLYVTLRGMIC